MDMPKIPALVSCQNDACAIETSYHLDMVGLWRGLPICEECYKEMRGEDDPDWVDLPPVTLDMLA